MNGIFFALEGLDNSGKTTIIRRLQSSFGLKPRQSICWTREPGGSDFGERTRKLVLDDASKKVPALPMLLAYMAGRASHYQEHICPLVNEGGVVVSDRFDASTYAFQLCGQEQENLLYVFDFLRKVILKDNLLLRPHYIYLHCSPEVSMRRFNEAPVEKRNHWDVRPIEFHQRVYQGYEDFFKNIDGLSQVVGPSENPVTYIDATRSINEVYTDVYRVIVEKCIEKGIMLS